jgi:hypothetical protein
MSMLESTIMGTADTVLADAGVATWDEDNSVTVQLDLATDTLSSATDVQVYNQTNWAVLGVDGAWEIFAFRTVVDNGNGNYTLSNFIRGLRNTEEMTGGHAVWDRFIMLDPANITPVNDGDINRYSMVSSMIGVAQTYKVVSLHEDPQESTGTEFTNNALGLKPYAPTQVAGSRDGSNNLTITWVRCGRIENGWNDLRDVPVGEDSEAYEIDIYDTDDGSFGTVIATYETSSEQLWIAAMQEAQRCN